ncbi:MAG: ribosome silencing factor [Bacteroidales bacterium]|jgi:ribosome-associated protein|nr:ribosome silencing factor [Bacteroidales bacterium]MCK9447777.1 ribosome silencing factor [Bacteroidales bacterium]MDD3700116.1 ribosome silencing factor [Bacteroidales bacterium]MDY0369060.1 ribosome silencing factor [Bacteroidales bacterium]
MRERHQYDNPELVLEVIVQTMQDRKGSNIVSLNLKTIHTAVTDYFVICHAASKTQVGAIADHILEKVSKQTGVKPYNKEGFENAEWILIDYIDVVVHVFLENTRDFYKIEKLWADAQLTAYEA